MEKMEVYNSSSLPTYEDVGWGSGFSSQHIIIRQYVNISLYSYSRTPTKPRFRMGKQSSIHFDRAGAPCGAHLFAWGVSSRTRGSVSGPHVARLCRVPGRLCSEPVCTKQVETGEAGRWRKSEKYHPATQAEPTHFAKERGSAQIKTKRCLGRSFGFLFTAGHRVGGTCSCSRRDRRGVLSQGRKPLRACFALFLQTTRLG